MLSLTKLLKPNYVEFRNSGLHLRYSSRDMMISMAVKGNNIDVPMDVSVLELPAFLADTLDEARSGFIKQNAWENPEIQGLNRAIGPTERSSLSYYIIMSFMRQCRTRDIWLTFRDIHSTLLSYLRNRAIANQLLLRYKIAILSCHLSGYGLTDLYKIERTFKNCGLDPENYIFYVLFLLDGYNHDVEFDDQEHFVLSVEEMERETKAFTGTTSITKLCHYQTATKLQFIVDSNRMSKGDMVNELIIATQLSYSTVRPFKTKAFSENYARRTMTNTALRIIQAYTKHKSKIRLVAGEHGSEATHELFTENTKNIDPSFHSSMASSLGYSEDDMIAYLDSKKRNENKSLFRQA